MNENKNNPQPAEEVKTLPITIKSDNSVEISANSCISNGVIDIVENKHST